MKSRLRLSASGAGTDCDDIWAIAVKKIRFPGDVSPERQQPRFYPVRLSVCVCECVFISLWYQEEQKLIQVSSSLDRQKPNREFQTKTADISLIYHHK